MRYPKGYIGTHDPVKYRIERRKKRRESGLCTRCNNPAVPGFTDCQNCMDSQKSKIAEIRAERKELGLCIQCGAPSRPDASRCEDCSHRLRLNGKNRQLTLKSAVMSAYGKNGNARCCWDGCNVRDLDMLTLDHLENNGAEHRRVYTKTGRGGGSLLYFTLQKQGFPAGYQTLCANHNLKKHILRLQSER